MIPRMNYKKILKEANNYIEQYVERYGRRQYAFHNMHHIANVSKAVDEISDYYKLYAEHYFIVKAGALFHDLGYISHGPQGHEAKGALLAKAFLDSKSVSTDMTQSVINCIMATRDKQHPTTFLESILCDADLIHLGKKNFSRLNFCMFQEIMDLRKFELDKNIWMALSIKFLENHQFHTSYVQDRYNNGKSQNLKLLKTKLTRLAISKNS